MLCWCWIFYVSIAKTVCFFAKYSWQAANTEMGIFLDNTKRQELEMWFLFTVVVCGFQPNAMYSIAFYWASVIVGEGRQITAGFNDFTSIFFLKKPSCFSSVGRELGSQQSASIITPPWEDTCFAFLWSLQWNIWNVPQIKLTTLEEFTMCSLILPTWLFYLILKTKPLLFCARP